MEISIIGLGKMGNAIAYRLLKDGHIVYGYDIDPKTCQNLKKELPNITILNSLQEVSAKTNLIWLMLPVQVNQKVIDELSVSLNHNHILIDGSNSYFEDSISAAEKLKKLKVEFVDCGVSGGLQGKEIGFCLMVGGSEKIFKFLEPIFKSIATTDGYSYIGVSGTGHYVKMIHNGIEYALLQSYAQGFHLLKEGKFKDLDLQRIASLWNHGSIIRSWILELINQILKENPDFKNISGKIGETGMGKWTVEQAKKQNISVSMIEEALSIRQWSHQTGGNFATKLVALLRNKFGGHIIPK
ncbi:decarboxylating 6-phosphogluconate dehydrogenase [Candidatus Dependentiae bacterium]|nr:decarboxylating 6-phosphogluconate dehydrogenase [Candidatus Dependentiae bacterium]